MNLGKDGRYHSSFRYEGKVYAVSGKSEKEVARKIGKMQAELKAGSRIKRKPLTVAKYAKEWVETYHDGDATYETIIQNHLIPDLGDRFLRDVTESQLQAWLNSKAEQYSWSYLSKMRMTLTQMFHKARKNHLITDDPAEDLVIPECKQGKRRSLTSEEKDLLLRVTQDHRGYLFVRCMLYCGIRPQEAAVLQWKHIDLDAGTMHIEQARKRKTGLTGVPKTDAGNRFIHIPDVLLSDLRIRQGQPEDYVCAWDGQPISQKKEARMWASILRAMDIAAGAKVIRNQIVESAIADDLQLYCLRHTCCTDWQKAGVPLNVAKEWMGHEDVSVTANIYTHATTEASQAAVELVNRAAEDRPKVVDPGDGIVYVRFGT